MAKPAKSKDTKFSKDNQPAIRNNGPAVAESNGKRRMMTEALMLALNQEVEDVVSGNGKKTKRLSQIAAKLAQKAVEGDIVAIKECFDRTEGKAAQAMILQGDPDNPIETRNQFVFVPVGADDEPDPD